MKEILYAIFIYPFGLADDIWFFFYNLFENIKYSFNKPKLKYDNIVDVDFFYDYIIDLRSTIFYKEGDNKPEENYAQIISLTENKFNEMITVLKENRILEYKPNIFRFSITPFWHLLCTDMGRGEERLTFKFSDGQVFRISSYCSSKRFDKVIKYLKGIIELEGEYVF